MGGGWVLEVDIQASSTPLDHAHLRSFLDQQGARRSAASRDRQVAEGGVLEDGGVSYPEAGTPQGGVISPLLANIYLHEVLDMWFENGRQASPAGEAGFWCAMRTTS